MKTKRSDDAGRAVWDPAWDAEYDAWVAESRAADAQWQAERDAAAEAADKAEEDARRADLDDAIWASFGPGAGRKRR